MITKEDCYCQGTGIISGFLMAAGHIYPVLAPLQAIALIPVLYLVKTKKIQRQDILTAGVYMGLAYTLPQMIVLRLPIIITLILTVHLTALMTIFVWASSKLLRGPVVSGALAIGALFAVLDWINFTVVPIWGMAQSFVRSWSWHPGMIGFVKLTGLTGIIFVLSSLQGLFVNFFCHPESRIRILITAIVILLMVVLVNILISLEKPVDKIRAAAIGWTSDSVQYNNIQSPKGFEELFAREAEQAASRGVKLIVTPEMGFFFGGGDREKILEQFGQVARRNNLFLAIGYFNTDVEENRLLFMNPAGQILGEYAKTHLTPFEHYNKGTGQLKTINIEGIRTGGMICQDDNFTGFSRRYGRKRVGLVVVPTLDWREVKTAHLQSSIHRAIESRYAIVRAAFNGISTIISPSGKILAYRDHFKDGPGMIIAEVPVYSCRTFFSIAGHWPVVISTIYIVIYMGYYIAKQQKGL